MNIEKLRDFKLYCKNATDFQLAFIFIKERDAGRIHTQIIVESECENRGIELPEIEMLPPLPPITHAQATQPGAITIMDRGQKFSDTPWEEELKRGKQMDNIDLAIAIVETAKDIRDATRNPEKDPIKGDLFVVAGGATMRYLDFFEVIAVKGSKVYLCTPNVKYEGNQDGYCWIESRNSQATGKLSYAKFVRGVLKWCQDDSFKIRDGWNALKSTDIGKKEHYYGD